MRPDISVGNNFDFKRNQTTEDWKGLGKGYLSSLPIYTKESHSPIGNAFPIEGWAILRHTVLPGLEPTLNLSL